ncbi:MAG: SLC13 family permease [Gammaproteobacteria bacterium]
MALFVYSVLPDQYLNEQGETVALSTTARAAAAVGLWMAIWWMTEAISVYATALLPLALFPLTGVATIKLTASSYGHEIIYLFLGGFILALALEKCGLHRRFAIRTLRLVGTRPAAIVGAFMAIAAFTSMWVTNTATTIMLLPVAISVCQLITANSEVSGDDAPWKNFSLCLFLGIAYAASIGGVGTIVGTAPNLFLVSFLNSQMNVDVSFVGWMKVGVPLVVVFVPLVWLSLCRFIYPVSRAKITGVGQLFDSLEAEIGRMSRAERRTLVIFLCTAGAWVTRPLLGKITIGGIAPLAGLSDPGIAVLAALALFVTPSGDGDSGFLMDWETAIRLPWGLLILFGGGLSLAAGLQLTGFSEFLGTRTAILGNLPVFVIVAALIALVIFLTELTSNTATTATLVPIVYAVAIGLGIDPLLLVVPAGIAASCAFMLPVATPPNAIVFGSGMVSIAQMARAGLWLNLLGILLISLLTYAIIVPALGVRI